MHCADTDPGLQYRHMPDEEVVAYARRGHARAAEHLLAKYRPLVERKARGYFLAGADHEDVVQEGMIGLFRAIHDFRAERLGRFRPFAEVCVTRRIISAVKSATRQKHAPLNDYVSLYHPLAGTWSGPCLLDALADERMVDPVRQAIEGRPGASLASGLEHALSGLETRVLRGYMEGLSYKEMSAALHCRPKSIDNALQRVKRKVGALLPLQNA